MIRILLFAGALAAAAPASAAPKPAAPEPVGDCVWARLGPVGQDKALSGYKAGMDQGMAALQAQDGAILAAARACTGRVDVPALWVRAIVISRMIQDGSALYLLEQRGLPRSILDRLWREAPPEARDCTRVEAAKPLGETVAGCTDREAGRWFLTTLEVEPTDRKAATEALTYYYGLAHGELAERLLARFLAAKPR